MTPTEDQLVKAGSALARSIGHRLSFRCPKASPAVPCTCGAGLQQAQALDEWARLVQDVEDS